MDIFPNRRDEHTGLITVRGDVDLATAGEFLMRLQVLTAPAIGPITLDLSQVTFMNSAGLRALIAFDRLVNATGGSVRLAVISPPVARVLELTAPHRGSVDVPVPGPGPRTVPASSLQDTT
ncbi:STAS domain-containing protein [Actinocrinis puniceicyclus]|uniref:Anti-sigma factor antagonist n=1 Tax=Actinocrinis puniceicyclus TaxID=977794 RepID=A0A8J8BD39_9ACTN|nr:STAS domain-containing protein [Actinocrinis puniceicyclus]MBS2964853.1 STAS domain-containing protein [Actinocrinis puniceicyclus]